jgi:Mg/Co/Ni transporter MgtE
MTHEPEHRDVIVEHGDGTGVGTVVGIILAIIVVLAIVWFLFLGNFNNNGGQTAPDQQQDIQINLPDQPAAT